ncbi:MAG: nicotinate phosphoribosyltransferase [Myxococcaceae bacterium]|nr:nicotinate phosphoribosyltransferase [Myxococcaceae bacterium]
MAWVNGANAGLLVDLYELTMADAYLGERFNPSATFDLFVRRLPPERNFLVACGLEQALEYLEGLRFGADALEALRGLRLLSDTFLDYLAGLHFTGEVWAFEEGDVAFGQEPLLRVTAPLIEAQVVESFLLNVITLQTMVASKAARLALACAGRPFVEFGMRRAHGADAALKGARAAFVGGAVGTSDVLAAATWGIPTSGTMAHSFVSAFPSELEAFRAFARHFRERSILLIDTFDTVQGAHHAARVAEELTASGVALRGVRIDSGDLADDTRRVREVLDAAGLKDMLIFLSGDLDEHRIRELLEAGVPVDAFGVGTQLATSGDAPSLGGVYKLSEVGDTPRMKLSRDKVTHPGRKQVLRFFEEGRAARDVISLEGETIPGGVPRLVKVMEKGRRLAPQLPLVALQERCRREVDALPESLRALTPAERPYPVELSPMLAALLERTRKELERHLP